MFQVQVATFWALNCTLGLSEVDGSGIVRIDIRHLFGIHGRHYRVC